MILEGIFSLSFESEQEQLGSGFATFKDGRIRGGDAEFLYDGTYQLTAFNSSSAMDFSAKVIVQYYKGINLTILGKMTRFPVKLSGVFTSDKISAHGKIEKFGSEEIDLHGIKIDDFQVKSSIDNGWSFFDSTLSIAGANSQHLLDLAFSSYENGGYIDATNTIFLVIKYIITKLLIASNEDNKKYSNFLDGIDILTQKGMVPENLYPSFQALATSDKVLNKKLNSPEDCAFPLCIIAFNLLEALLKLQQQFRCNHSLPPAKDIEETPIQS